MTSSNSRLKDEAAAARAAIMEQMRSGYGRMLGVEGPEERQDVREDPSFREERTGNFSQKEDPRFGAALEWVESLRAQMEREEVHPSDLMRLISEALTVIESFIIPDTEMLAEEADALFQEASEILASLDGTPDARRKVERALQILTASIERAEAAGKAVPKSYQLRSRAYEMLAEMDRTGSLLQ